mmetsp:Transcript_814/g.1767  ORF Transcript_814/g.1767 Transcript_814/m.1767 type:complete len:178 (+) Transcript_814:692-1225(+)
MLDWTDDTADSGQPGLKIVILKPMFSLEDMRREGFEKVLQEEILQEVESRIGEVERIRIFSHNPEGVVQLKFASVSSAEKCIEMMQGRYYSGRRLECFYWDGKTDYKRVRSRQCHEDEETEKQRIEEFGKWLECFYWDGKTDYKRCHEDEETEKQRIEEFGKWLEEQDSSEDEATTK